MIGFTLNNEKIAYDGNPEKKLLGFLRNEKEITSPKDGCSEQGVCGACTVEINGKARMACTVKMRNLQDASIFTLEGIPENIRDIIAKSFVNEGAVQCGFCSPGFVMRTKVLLANNPSPTIEEIRKAIRPNLCRCTGYKKIENGVLAAATALKENKSVEIRKTDGKIGTSHPKYDAYETAIGKRDFVNDIKIKGLLHSALKFSDFPRAKVISIDASKAKKLDGVKQVFTAKDIPGQRTIGLIFRDWEVMISEGATTNYIGDVLAGVVATDEETARKAVELIEVQYEELQPVTDVFEALKDEITVHNRSNLLENCIIKRGNAKEAFAKSAFTTKGHYETQRIEHAFLEFEAAIGLPKDDGIEVISQGQGIYEDQRQISEILNINPEKVRVTLVPNGGGFGGKEDLSVQGHAALFAFLLQQPVKLSLTREESIRMHPKRHPVFMDIELGADKNGKLTAIKLRAVGDTGAYASVGTKVLERVAGHATAGYFVPVSDIEAKTVYTNNIPCGAMRGFGANQVSFAIEACIDELCEKGGFDRWQFRYDNALVDGLRTSTGQKVFGVGIRACLEKLKPYYENAKYSGIACAIKNSGVGNGMADFSDVKIHIKTENHILLEHGWTEMGQGVHNMALQTLCNELGIKPEIIEIRVDTNAEIKTGMTTSSRATALVGNAVIDASKKIRKDLEGKTIKDLAGNVYKGRWICDWTTKPGAKADEPITHYSYGYAAQLCVLDDKGNIDTIYAAHDVGKIMNPMLFEGQVEGAVHMGTGYALTEDLPMKEGRLISDKLRDCKVLRAHETPNIVVLGVEVKDQHGPYGAKGVGEIGLVPTAATIANAFFMFDGKRRTRLPMMRK